MHITICSVDEYYWNISCTLPAFLRGGLQLLTHLLQVMFYHCVDLILLLNLQPPNKEEDLPPLILPQDPSLLDDCCTEIWQGVHITTWLTRQRLGHCKETARHKKCNWWTWQNSAPFSRGTAPCLVFNGSYNFKDTGKITIISEIPTACLLLHATRSNASSLLTWWHLHTFSHSWSFLCTVFISLLTDYLNHVPVNPVGTASRPPEHL